MLKDSQLPTQKKIMYPFQNSKENKHFLFI